MRPLSLVLLFLLRFSFPLLAAPVQPIPSPADPPQVVEFDKAPLPDVLRKLGRAAKVNLILEDSIAGTVTIRAEVRSPMEALQMIVEAKGLQLEESSFGPNIYYVQTRETHAKLLESLDSAAFPIAIARYKHRLYKALLHEGFTEKQAMEIVTTEHTPVADVPIFKP
jgi:hypothetical protein